MEIGSFIGLDLKNTGEFYNGEADLARLNSGRAGIYHSCRLYDCNSIYIPHYLCPEVKRFLLNHGIEVISYFINESFEPIDIKQEKNRAVLLVNYFGILALNKMSELASRFQNVVIDNSAAFYADPIEGCFNIYSARKFFGVPDGCYVIGKNATKYVDGYKQDFSSKTATFLLKRLEYSTSETYIERMKNEDRIDQSDILKMSLLSRSLLTNIDYLSIKEQRRSNYQFADGIFGKINKYEPTKLSDGGCVPMVYPLVIEDANLTERLKRNKIFVGRLWKHVVEEVPDYSFEAFLSRYLVPIPIDQRYGREHLLNIYDCVVQHHQ